MDIRTFHGTSIFYIYKDIIEMELQGLELFLNDIENDLRGKQKSLADGYNQVSSMIKDIDEGPDLSALFEDELHKYFKTFPIFTYNPLLITLYGYFENWLRKLCELYQHKGLSKIGISHLGGSNYIQKSRQYFELVAEIDLTETNKLWGRITEIQQIRNCIVHNHSTLESKDDKDVEQNPLYHIIRKFDSIEVDTSTGEFFIKDKEFIVAFISTIRQYIAYIIPSLQKKRVIVKNSSTKTDRSEWAKARVEGILKATIDLISSRDELGGEAFVKQIFSNSTELLAFLGNATWKEEDPERIIQEGTPGFNRLKQIYFGTNTK